MGSQRSPMNSMSSTYNQYYGVIRKVSSLAGQWPYQASRMKLLCISLITLTVFSMLVPQVAKFVRCDDDLQCIFESTTSYMLTFITLVKLYTCYFNQYKIKTIVDHLSVNWDGVETSEEHEILKKYAENGRRFTLLYSLYCFISIMLFMVIAVTPKLLDVISPLNESRAVLMPYPAYYFVDEEEYFLHIMCHAVMSGQIMMTGVVAHDCLLRTCVEHICSIFAVAGFRFERLTYETVLHACSSGDCRRHIAFSVRMHQKALEFAQLLTETFSVSLAIQVAMNAVMISVTLLQVTQQNADVFDMTKYVLYVIALLIHLFHLNYGGQKLIDHCILMREKIYDSPWYKTSVVSKGILLFVTQRSCQPIFLNAGKVLNFSLETFTMILQTSMSFFTVLTSLM